MSATALARPVPALPAKLLVWRGQFAASGTPDPVAGTIPGVSLMTADLQPRGYSMYVDDRTLQTLSAALGTKLKAYVRHSWGDRTGEEAGTWSNFRVDGKNFRADFAALKAWLKHSPREAETLFELAALAPEEFGASAVFAYQLAWVCTTGEEIECRAAGWRWSEEAEDYLLEFTPSAPADALRDIPSVRVTEAFSCDFVDVPAANRGLFSAEDLGRESGALPPRPVDEAGKGALSSNQSIPFAMIIKDLNAKFGTHPALLARAVALHAANDKLTFAEVVAQVEGEVTQAELGRLRAADTASQAEFGKLEKAGFKAADGKTLVDAALAEHAAFKAKATEHDTTLAALKAAGFEAKDGKSALDQLLAAFKQKTADIATLRAGGTLPVSTEASAGAPAQLSGLARVSAAFAAKQGKN